MKSVRVPQQIIRLAVCFALVIAALITARRLLIPKSFGVYGHYRADAIDEIVSHQLNYAGYEACVDCHDDIYEVKMQSRHKGVACETCHGPAAKHVDAPGEYIPPAPRKRGYCPLCHGYNVSRPSGFPQIIPKLHNPGKACMSCHNPHNPQLPHPPEECSACHRVIVSQKMVSHHVGVACTTCHTVPDEHLINPRFVKVSKPKERKFCGRCHGKNADSPKEIPRINLATHYERYLCWDCHYPHYPEANR